MPFIKTLSTILFAFTATACTTINIPYDFSTEKYPDKGILVASTSIPTFDETVGFSLLYHIKKVEAKDTEAPKFGELEYLMGENRKTKYFKLEVSQSGDSSDFANTDGKVHARILDAGEYELVRWSMSTGYNKFIHPHKLKPVRFKIIPGKITYLGNLHMNNSYGKNIFGVALARGGLVSFYDEENRDIKKFQTKSDISLPVIKQLPDVPVWLPENKEYIETIYIPQHLNYP